MPVDPNISLQVAVPQPQMAGAAMNPLGAINSLAELQLRMNQNALFQQQFQANHLMGSIMAGSPDVETGFQRILQSPAAPFAGQFLNNARSAEKTLLDMSVARSGLAKTALEGYLKNLSGALADPTMIPKLGEASLATVTDPLARSQLGSAISSLNTALIDDNVKSMAASGDPQQVSAARSLLNSRIVGLLAGNNVGADTLRALTGTIAPSFQNLPNQTGGTTPSIVGGGVLGSPGQIQSLTGMTPPPGTAGAPEPGSPEAQGLALAQQAPAPTGLGAPSTYRAENYKLANEYKKNLIEYLGTANQFSTNMQEIVNAASQAQLGGGAGAFRSVAQGLQALNRILPKDAQFTDKFINEVGNQSLPGTQVIDKLALDNVMLRARQMLQGIGGSRFNMQEFVKLVESNPNVTTDPRALKEIFNLWMGYNNRYRAEMGALDSFERSGGDVTRWPAMWQQSPYMKNFAPSSLDFSSVKGLGPTPASDSAAQAPAPAQTRATVPAKNDLNRPSAADFFR